MKFQFSKVTQSRLMGSIGIHIRWSEEDDFFDQFFLLDAEGSGIADYVSLRNGSNEEIYMEEQRLMGGLGSAIIKITKKETLNLLYEYGKININNHLNFPEPFIEYKKLLKKDTSITDEELLSKICTTIIEPVEFINYLTMRFVAKDLVLLNYFSYYGDSNFDFVTNSGSTLLKNSVDKIGIDTYSATAIVEENDGYYQIKLGFSIISEGRFFFRTILGSKRQQLSTEEAVPHLRRSEYIAIFRIENSDISQKLIKKIPNLYKVTFENGVLYTCFKPNNNHVRNSDYRISDDLAGMYFLKEKELVFVALEEYYYERGLKLLSEIKEVILEDELFSIKPLLYEYAQSQTNNFYEFLEQQGH